MDKDVAKELGIINAKIDELGKYMVSTHNTSQYPQTFGTLEQQQNMLSAMGMRENSKNRYNVEGTLLDDFAAILSGPDAMWLMTGPDKERLPSDEYRLMYDMRPINIIGALMNPILNYIAGVISGKQKEVKKAEVKANDIKSSNIKKYSIEDIMEEVINKLKVYQTYYTIFPDEIKIDNNNKKYFEIDLFGDRNYKKIRIDEKSEKDDISNDNGVTTLR